MTAADAVTRAREVLGDHDASAQALRVDRPAGKPYWLVVLDGPTATVGLAAFEDDGTLVGSGRPSSAGRHVSVGRQRAQELLGAPVETEVHLVWWPSRASMSPLFPLWQADLAEGPRWVTLDGTLVEDVPPAGRA
jgi:hypothetical protein